MLENKLIHSWAVRARIRIFLLVGCPVSGSGEYGQIPKTSELTIPDLDGTALGEGEHLIGEAQTPRGKLEVRVSVQDQSYIGPDLSNWRKTPQKNKVL